MRTADGAHTVWVRRRGLTLVELLVTSALMALVAGASVATLSGGFKVWQRLQTLGQQSQWIEVAFDEMRRDFRNARRFSLIPFKGTYNQVSFPTLVEVRTDADVSWQEIGRTGYYLDRRDRRLCRSQHPYRVIRRRRLQDACVSVMSDVERLTFSYYRFDRDTETYAWTNSWSSSEPPLAVKMEIGHRDPATRRIMTRSLLVQLPAAPRPVPADADEI